MTEVDSDITSYMERLTMPSTLIINNSEVWNETMELNATIPGVSETFNYGLHEDQIVEAISPGLTVIGTYAYILWYSIGFPANTIALVTWIQRQMMQSSGCYLVALAITDNIFLVVHAAVISTNKWFPTVNLLNYPVLCQMLPMLYTAAQFMSALLVLEFTIEQYIAICHPFKRSRFCRVSIARKVIVGVTFLAIALSAPQAYFFTLYDGGAGNHYCIVRPSLLAGKTESFWSVWTWSTEMTLFGVVPTSCLLLNLRVIYQVSKQGKVKLTRNYSVSNKNGSGKAPKKRRAHATTTMMLLAVSLYWVFTEIPATVTLGLRQAYEVPYVTSREELKANPAIDRFMGYITARTVIEVICFSRYSCKLFFYLATGRQFRKNLHKLLKCTNRKVTVTTTGGGSSYTSGYTAGQEQAHLLRRGKGKVKVGRDSTRSRDSKGSRDSKESTVITTTGPRPTECKVCWNGNKNTDLTTIPCTTTEDSKFNTDNTQTDLNINNTNNNSAAIININNAQGHRRNVESGEVK